jgi:hypothetical protein
MPLIYSIGLAATLLVVSVPIVYIFILHDYKPGCKCANKAISS